ncbi:MAG TPA: endolytic transglycosylase MltG [Gemmatimonadaceae bacterium]|nr:endolytic transglycosylase MltG [Gemmatimonadaceae bacterium]
MNAKPIGLLAVVATLGACANGSGVVKVVIPPGTSLRVAADSLANSGVIHAKPLFRLYATIRGWSADIPAGTYALRRGAGWETILSALRGGKGRIAVVTVPEGFSVAQIAHLLETKLGVSADSMRAAVSDSELLHQVDDPTATLEGYLFPDTYTFPQGTTAREAVRAMVRHFEQVWRPEWTARLDSIPMSRHDVLTLASIVEKEAKLPEERPVIAAVYMNRLRDGMLLESDPTVQYALGGHEARVLDRQLRVDSPYNTYKHKGLPPGPIASPGRASIVAALYPARVPYKYFVAFPDGHHEFRLDLAAHRVAAAAARRAWDAWYAHGHSGGAPPMADTTRAKKLGGTAPASGPGR